MENLFKAAFIFLSLFTSTCFADTLILSAKLKIEYMSPQSIAHGSNNLIVKYKDWSFMHVVVDPKDLYQKIDLAGMEKDYIRSIFDEKARAKLPKSLAITAKEQAGVLGVSPETTEIFTKGKAEVFSVYDQKDKKGQIFIIEDLSVHQIYTNGDKTYHDLIAHNIKER